MVFTSFSHKELQKYTFFSVHNQSLLFYTQLKVSLKQEGETCGRCFNPDTNFDCGTCASGLECVKDPRSNLLPDVPSKCRKKPGNISFIRICSNEQLIVNKIMKLQNKEYVY